MSEIRTNVRDVGAAETDELNAMFERRRFERATGTVNTSPYWQVRIGWGSAPPIAFPPFTYDVKDSRADAEYCARWAEGWRSADDADLYVIAAWVRGPGACAWEPVSVAQVGAA
jgi:hypothetical protein